MAKGLLTRRQICKQIAPYALAKLLCESLVSIEGWEYMLMPPRRRDTYERDEATDGIVRTFFFFR